MLVFKIFNQHNSYKFLLFNAKCSVARVRTLAIFLNKMPAGNAFKIGAQVAKLLLNTAKI